MNVEKAEALVEAIKADQIYPENLMARIDQEEMLLDGGPRRFMQVNCRRNCRWKCPVMRKWISSNYSAMIAIRNCGYIDPGRPRPLYCPGGYFALYKALTE